ncbi:MAG: Rpn family recombination-promoting nuclease/putative transposase [Lachnospiraceae bacterium]|nr:Rpn family recombination-promoting nuclease/putative transposase [Lachnospiraceae bacterium]
MGELNAVDYKYLSDNSRYADLFNGVLFGGEQVLIPDKLTGEDTKLVTTNETVWRERSRDLIRKYENGASYAVLGIENQENVSYIMPFRIMEYEAGEYSKQIEEMQKKHKDSGDVSGDEFLSKFAKTDKVNPCVTLVLYWGENWDGPESLKDMLNLGGLPEQMKAYVNDYPMHLVNVREFENTDVFRTDLKLVFDFMKCAEDKKCMTELVVGNPAYQRVPRDAWKMMQVHGKLEEPKVDAAEDEEEEAMVNVCRAIDDIKNDAMERGIERGRSEGLEIGLKNLVKVLKGQCKGFEELYNSLIGMEGYESLTREQVSKYV